MSLLRCEKLISNPSFDLYLTYLQHRPSGTDMFVDAGIEKLILLPSSQATSNTWKGEEIEEKFNLYKSVFSRCHKVLHRGSLEFPQLTVNCLPTDSIF